MKLGSEFLDGKRGTLPCCFLEHVAQLRTRQHQRLHGIHERDFLDGCLAAEIAAVHCLTTEK
ncbi:hypothetical protein [Mesorhizobium sp. M1A.F.Ca.ET.072.01.1.1]|uniref:hypothetical protein n=1 Tax=Mesorhizobium sp. M1A.F.Ca.ET.072.01.1.1 TaxID=2496753 RepID=UPI00167BE180|nr:hypothetical protein [Mesorhizobium sp. M1A.F.Ca.ET.072.01.1.1]